MKVLLGSGGFRTEERINKLCKEMKSFFAEGCTLLFIPYALQDHDEYLRILVEKGLNGGFSLVGIHRCADPAKAVREAEGVYVGGGNTFRLLSCLYHYDLIEPLQKRVGEGMPYLGISAGCNVACPTMMTTNDMPIIFPPSFSALGLVPFQVNPHYYSGNTFVQSGTEYVQHFGETRDDRIREFHEMNERPVVGLWEGGILRREGSQLNLRHGLARLFRKGQEPEDFQAGSDLSFLLNGN